MQCDKATEHPADLSGENSEFEIEVENAMDLNVNPLTTGTTLNCQVRSVYTDGQLPKDEKRKKPRKQSCARKRCLSSSQDWPDWPEGHFKSKLCKYYQGKVAKDQKSFRQGKSDYDNNGYSDSSDSDVRSSDFDDISDYSDNASDNSEYEANLPPKKRHCYESRSYPAIAVGSIALDDANFYDELKTQLKNKELSASERLDLLRKIGELQEIVKASPVKKTRSGNSY